MVMRKNTMQISFKMSIIVTIEVSRWIDVSVLETNIWKLVLGYIFCHFRLAIDYYDKIYHKKKIQFQ